MTKNWIDLPPVPLVNIPRCHGSWATHEGLRPAPTARRGIPRGGLLLHRHRMVMYLAATDSGGIHTDSIGGVTYGHRQSIPRPFPGRSGDMSRQ